MKEQAIVVEDFALFYSEMASWYGIGVFLETFPDMGGEIRGYFSYSAGVVHSHLPGMDKRISPTDICTLITL